MINMLQQKRIWTYYGIFLLVCNITFTYSQNSKDVARFIIINCPNEVVVKADKEILHHDIGGWYTVSAGKTKINILKNDSVIFSSTFKFRPNDEKRIIFDCSIDCISLEITSDPPEAQIFIDGEDYGFVPYKNLYTKPGKHKIKLDLYNYASVNREISLSAENTEKINFSLEHSQAYRDSIKLVNIKGKRIRQRWRKIIFGIVTASFAGAGIYYELQARSDISDANKAAREYDNAKSKFENYKDSYLKHRMNAKESLDLRNILLGTAGISLAGFGSSFIF
jgi:hypothetical protein